MRPHKTHLWLYEPDAMVVCGLFLSFVTAEDWRCGTHNLASVTCRRCLRVANQEWVSRRAAMA